MNNNKGLIRGQRYKEFHIINFENNEIRDIYGEKEKSEFHLFYVDKVRLDIVYCNLIYQKSEQVIDFIDLDFSEEICIPMDTGDFSKIAKYRKDIFLDYVEAEIYLNELINKEIEEIEIGKNVTEFLRNR